MVQPIVLPAPRQQQRMGFQDWMPILSQFAMMKMQQNFQAKQAEIAREAAEKTKAEGRQFELQKEGYQEHLPQGLGDTLGDIQVGGRAYNRPKIGFFQPEQLKDVAPNMWAFGNEATGEIQKTFTLPEKYSAEDLAGFTVTQKDIGEGGKFGTVAIVTDSEGRQVIKPFHVKPPKGQNMPAGVLDYLYGLANPDYAKHKNRPTTDYGKALAAFNEGRKEPMPSHEFRQKHWLKEGQEYTVPMKIDDLTKFYAMKQKNLLDPLSGMVREGKEEEYNTLMGELAKDWRKILQGETPSFLDVGLPKQGGGGGKIIQRLPGETIEAYLARTQGQ